MLRMPIPADVPAPKHQVFEKNSKILTKETGRVLIFAADHFIEHPMRDFHGPLIDPSARDPEHVFRIASAGQVGALAAPLGLIARYAPHYPTIPYIAKMNSKTDFVPLSQRDPVSTALWTIDQVQQLREQARIFICGIGYTIYIGSEYEQHMLHEAAQLIYQAHQHGLIAILWMIPRGNNIPHERDGGLIAGAAGIACSLGADIVKIKVPEDETTSTHQWLNFITRAAGNTRVICAGGNKKDEYTLLTEVADHMNNSDISGYAIGKNIFQLPAPRAIALSKALAAIVFAHASADQAYALYQGML